MLVIYKLFFKIISVRRRQNPVLVPAKDNPRKNFCKMLHFFVTAYQLSELLNIKIIKITSINNKKRLIRHANNKQLHPPHKITAGAIV